MASFEPKVEARGNSLYTQPLLKKERVSIFFSDLCFELFLLGALFAYLQPPPSLSKATLFGLLAVQFVWRFGFYQLTGSTIGGLLYRSQITSKPLLSLYTGMGHLKLATHSPSALTRLPQLIWGGFILVFIALYFIVTHTHPFFKKASTLTLEPFQVDASMSVQSEWRVLPFYYAKGLWLKMFKAQEVRMELPYQKGPPTLFAGSVIAKINNDASIVIYGPKTIGSNHEVEALKSCSLNQTLCPYLREQMIGKHLRDLKTSKTATLSIAWFQNIQNKTQGIHLAQTSNVHQERFIFISPDGLQQAFELLTSDLVNKNEIQKIFHQMMGSITLSDSLSGSRAIAEQQLRSLTLNLESIQDPVSFIHLALDVQSVLITRFLIEPKDLESLFHLAGVSLHIVRFGTELQTRKTQVLSGAIATSLSEIIGSSRDNIKSALKYAEDVNREDPIVARIRQIWSESEKY